MRWLHANVIKYTSNFCDMLVNKTFRNSYNFYKHYNPYISNVIKLFTCINVEDVGGGNEGRRGGGNGNNALPPFIAKIQDNPLNMSDFWKMETCDQSHQTFLKSTACEHFCSNFNIAAPTPLLDGDVHNYIKLYKFLHTFKPAFKHPWKNLFRSDVVLLEKDIQQLYKGMDPSYYFYKPVSFTVNIAEYGVNFDNSVGIDPMELARGTELTFSYESASIIDILAILMFLILNLF